MKSDSWTLYLLYHPEANRTYLGVTTDVTRRLRQHRGEIVGGARYTARIQPSSNWQLIATVSNFQNQAEVTRWERLLKLRTKGLQARLDAMKSLGRCEHPKSFTEDQRARFDIPMGLLCEEVNYGGRN